MASLTEMTRASAERLASRLAKQGELQSGQVGRFAEDLVRRGQRNREVMTRLVQREVKRQLSLLGIATRDEVARLQQRVRALEQAVERPVPRSGRSAASSRSAASPGSTAAKAATSKGSTSKAGTARAGSSGGARKTASGRATGTAGRAPGDTGGRGSGGTGGRGSSRTRGRSSSDTGQETSQGE
jgi:polyhydroxyalkanoate synthesis regulator phasin